MKLLDFFKNPFKSTGNENLKKALNFSGMSGWNFTNSIDECGELIINLELFYRLQKSNATCQSLKDLVSLRVAKNGLYLTKPNGDIADKPRDKEYLKGVLEYFETPTLQSFKNDYFTHYFAGGEIFIAQKESLYGTQPVLVDNRTIKKKIDKKTGAIV